MYSSIYVLHLNANYSSSDGENEVQGAESENHQRIDFMCRPHIQVRMEPEISRTVNGYSDNHLQHLDHHQTR